MDNKIEKIDPVLDPCKFQDPTLTADGNRRAYVALKSLETLWFNTGTLCNITCASCYIESSPTNDRLTYLSVADVSPFLDEIEQQDLQTREIGFTGGEPFMNPNMIAILNATLRCGHRALVLTNAMQPMMRPRVQAGLQELVAAYGDRLTLRVSLDHYTCALHESERGIDTWDKAMAGLRWLSANKISLHIAGRTLWQEDEDKARRGYGALFAREGIEVDAQDPAQLILFPEMDEAVDVPEITTDCWSILGKDPQDLMCSNSRMIVRRKGAEAPVVLPCTLLPYDTQFELGTSLSTAEKNVSLNHPHCAKFCVLGGGSCAGE